MSYHGEELGDKLLKICREQAIWSRQVFGSDRGVPE